MNELNRLIQRETWIFKLALINQELIEEMGFSPVFEGKLCLFCSIQQCVGLFLYYLTITMTCILFLYLTIPLQDWLMSSLDAAV